MSIRSAPKEDTFCSLDAEMTFPIEFSGPGILPCESAVRVRAFVCFMPIDSTYQSAIFSRTAESSSAGLPSSRQLAASFITSRKSGGGASPTARRSFIRVAIATCQPSPIAPSRWLSGTRTLVKKTSLKFEPPLICLIGLMSIPGDFMSMKKKVRPLCLGRDESWRATRMP